MPTCRWWWSRPCRCSNRPLKPSPRARGLTCSSRLMRHSSSRWSSSASGRPRERGRRTGEAMGSLILVVEDDPDIATVLRDRLQAMGHEVMTVGDGQAALDTLQKVTPSLMFLDIELPKLNGIEVLKRVQKEWPDLPVVVMTAYGTISRAVEAMKEGATDFITKPFDNEYLHLVIGKTLERCTLKREVTALRSELESRLETLVAASPKMNAVIESAKKVA